MQLKLPRKDERESQNKRLLELGLYRLELKLHRVKKFFQKKILMNRHF